MKVKWGGDDVATEQDINEAEAGFAPYAGPIAPSGVYRFKVERVRFTEFASGNFGLKVLLLLDGSWRKEHAQYDGCPLWTNVVNVKAAAGFVKAFCDAIGVTSKEFLSAMVIDDDKNVVTIGRKKISGQGLLVFANTKRSKQSEDSPWRLEGAGTCFIPAPANAEAEEPEDESADADAAEEPTGKKSKKDKGKGKKADKKGGKTTAPAEDDDPPF